LVQFDKDIPVLIGKRKHRHLHRTIASIGFTDIRELPFDEYVELDGIKVAILAQFDGTVDGYQDDVGYDLDSSLLVEDVDGTRMLHIVDNPI